MWQSLYLLGGGQFALNQKIRRGQDDMLTVWSVCIGDKYDDSYVYRLKSMVEKNLSAPHEFKCISDRYLEGINCVLPLQRYHSWWSKINLFGMADGPSLYFDLDVVIVGSLDYLIEYTQYPLAAPANWAQSGHGGIQSSVMAWNGTLKEPYRKFNYEIDSKRLWGDQEFLTELYGDNYTKIPGIKSYKYHCTQGLPLDARVVVFHGKPDYHEVSDPWVRKFAYTQTNTSNTKSNTPDTLNPALQDTA